MRHCYLLLTVTLFVSPALADLVDVTISGQGNGSGDIYYFCPPMECTGTFSFGGTNNNSDNFTASGTSTPPPVATLSGMVQQDTSVSPTSFSVDLQSVATFDSPGAFSAQVTLGNTYDLSFTLTTASLMDLSGLLTTSSVQFPGTYCSLDNADTGVNTPLPCGGNQSFNEFDESLSLGPGTYDLSIMATLGTQFGPLPDETQVATDQLVLTADFTATPIPEPRWSAMAVALLLGFAATSASIRRRWHA